MATAGVADTYLLEDKRAALAAPQLIRQMGTLSVDRWPLLHDESQTTWREWLTNAGLPTGDAIKGPNFSDHSLMLDAAAAAHGVALGSLVCAAPHLSSGALVVLEGPTFSQPEYRMYCDLRSYKDERIRRVYEWFVEATRRHSRHLF